MAEEVTKTIENVDRLFSEIVVNGEVHHSENYVPPVVIEQTPPVPVVEEETPSTPSEQSTQGQYVYAVELNEVLHPFVDQEATQDIREEANIRRQADSALQQSVSTIQGLIPNQASSENKLADKNFVNSSIATNTANFLGTYTSMADIEAIQDPTNNDYVFLQTTDAQGNNLFDRYKYNADNGAWLFEYELNNSSFTAEQWATINSGLTQSSVDQDIQDAISALAVPLKETLSASRADTITRDKLYFIDIAGVILTLNFGSSQQAKVEVYALEDCSVSYYTDLNTVNTLSMLAGTRATWIYFNGWKLHGVYGAVWN